ncbi:MAG: methyltransferase domain-containing protein [Patescibacteria group bacterium]
MKYFFILGKNPTLSIAELEAFFSCSKEIKILSRNVTSENVLILETDKEIEAKNLIKKLGGVIKIGKIETEVDNNIQDILIKIKSFLKTAANGKFKFGISYYGQSKFNIKPLAMEIKKYLKERGISSRWVTSREPTLSSVVVEQNKLVNKGIEIIIIKKQPEGENRDSRLQVGHTLAVQPFKDLSFRDYGRPARDDRSGMLPPKLAIIMINLAMAKSSLPLIKGEDGRGSILDPFCGSGTILTEAILMGYKNIIGADTSKKAIADTEKNINWLKTNFQLPAFNYQLINSKVEELSKHIKPNSIDAIITEPYLGPQRGKININTIISELENLYSQAFVEFYKILKSNGKIVMIWPVFRKQEAQSIKHISPDIKGFKIIYPIPINLYKNANIHLTKRNTIIYGRENQKVWREIVCLTKS